MHPYHGSYAGIIAGMGVVMDSTPIDKVEHAESNEPIIAYRCWSLSPINLLSSAATPSMSWPRLNPMHAVCLAQSSVFEHHEAPAEDHSCGIYAMKTVAALAKTFHYGPSVIGRVALWGEVIEHEDGYRAEYAYPQVFFYDTGRFPEDRARKLAAEYGCEVLPMPKELIEVADGLQDLTFHPGYPHTYQGGNGMISSGSLSQQAFNQQPTAQQFLTHMLAQQNTMNQSSQMALMLGNGQLAGATNTAAYFGATRYSNEPELIGAKRHHNFFVRNYLLTWALSGLAIVEALINLARIFTHHG